MMNNSENITDYLTPQPLNESVSQALVLFEQIKSMLDLDAIEDRRRQDRMAQIARDYLGFELSSRALFSIGERLELTGQISAVRNPQDTDNATVYDFMKCAVDKRLEGRFTGMDVLPLPTAELQQDIGVGYARYYSRASPFVEFGLAFSLDQLITIGPSKNERVRNVRHLSRTDRLFPVGYSGLNVFGAIPREAEMDQYKR